MNIDTNTIVSMTEANQNFSMVTRIVDQYGTAVIFKNNKPRYEVKVFDDAESDKIAADEDVLDPYGRKFPYGHQRRFKPDGLAARRAVGAGGRFGRSAQC